MKKILVLGSSGQIGAPLVRYLSTLGYDVEEFDILREAYDEDLRVHGNPFLERAVQENDFVVFLAFDIGGSLYMEKYQNTYDFINNNVRIMERTFQQLHKTDTPFIFASSQMSNMLHSSYGVLKSIGEYYTRSLGGLVVKFWNVYGVEHDLERSHVITDFINMADIHGEITMRTDGEEVRQFLHTDDCSAGILALIDSYEDIDREESLHLTNFKWHSILDIADIISDSFDGCPILPGTTQDNVQRGLQNEPDDYILNFWEPEISLKKGINFVIKDMIELGIIGCE